MLTLVMVLTLVPTSVFAYYEEGTVDVSAVKEIKTISLNQKYDVLIEKGTKGSNDLSTTKWFKFTPNTTENYVFYSEGTYDTYVSVYTLEDGIYEYNDSDDDCNASSNFEYLDKLEAGKTYYFCVSTYYQNGAYFKVGIEKTKSVASISFANHSTVGFVDADWDPGVEIDINYSDGTKLSTPYYFFVRSGEYDSEQEYQIEYMYDRYGNKILIKMLGKDCSDYASKVARKYSAKVALVDSEGTEIKKCDVSFELVKIADYFKNASVMRVGTVFNANSPYEGLEYFTPYVLNVEDDNQYVLDNLSERGVYNSTYLALFSDNEDGTYSKTYCDAGDYASLDKGKYYVLFTTTQKGKEFLFGYSVYGAYVPATGISAPATLEMEVNTTKNIGAKVLPETSTDGLTYTSSNPSVATVDARGNIKAVAAGKATITIFAGSGKVAYCNVTVANKYVTTTVNKPEKVKKFTLKNSKKRAVTIKITKAKNAKKYIVKYTTDKKFKKKIKTKTIKGTKYTFKKLTKGKKYYFKVCGVNGSVKGPWSKKVGIKVKK